MKNLILLILFIAFLFIPILCNADPDRYENSKTFDGDYHFHEIKDFVGGMCIGSLGEMDYIIDCKTKKPSDLILTWLLFRLNLCYYWFGRLFRKS